MVSDGACMVGVSFGPHPQPLSPWERGASEIAAGWPLAAKSACADWEPAGSRRYRMGGGGRPPGAPTPRGGPGGGPGGQEGGGGGAPGAPPRKAGGAQPPPERPPPPAG